MASNNTKKDETEVPVETNHDNNAKGVKVTDAMDKIKDEFVQLCRDLSMDVSTSDAAWASYDAIKQNYTLEVRILTCIYIHIT